MQAAFYGVGATVIGIITLAAYKLAKLTIAKDKLQWAIFAVMAVVTAWTESEILWLFLLSGVIAMVAQAPPAWLRRAGAGLPGGGGDARPPRPDLLVLHEGGRVRLRQRPGDRALSLRRRRPGVRLAQ